MSGVVNINLQTGQATGGQSERSQSPAQCHATAPGCGSGAGIVMQGQPGPVGPAGPSGGGEGLTFDFPASITWTINHNLGRQPFITLLTPGGLEMVAGVAHASLNQSVITFASATAGRARVL